MLKTYMKRIEDSGENPRDLDSVNETNYEQVNGRDFVLNAILQAHHTVILEYFNIK